MTSGTFLIHYLLFIGRPLMKLTANHQKIDRHYFANNKTAAKMDLFQANAEIEAEESKRQLLLS